MHGVQLPMFLRLWKNFVLNILLATEHAMFTMLKIQNFCKKMASERNKKVFKALAIK